jgi:hypothetical protein
MAIMTGVQSAQILGPHTGPGIFESKTENNPVQERRFGKMVPGGRRGNNTGLLKKRNDDSIIDFIN